MNDKIREGLTNATFAELVQYATWARARLSHYEDEYRIAKQERTPGQAHEAAQGIEWFRKAKIAVDAEIADRVLANQNG